MEMRRLALPEVMEIVPRRFGDDRGFFAEAFNRRSFAEHGIAVDWVQDNQSLSVGRHTLRGLHYQAPPFAQDKLVRVLKGSILDVAVDIREGSPTYRRWVALEVSASAFNQIFVPMGFAHGFLTLEPETEVLYKVSAPYAAVSDRSLRWDDPDLGIAWPLGGSAPILSAKDAAAPRLAEVVSDFRYDQAGAPT